jgi:hypothetical protein
MRGKKKKRRRRRRNIEMLLRRIEGDRTPGLLVEELVTCTNNNLMGCMRGGRRSSVRKG